MYTFKSKASSDLIMVAAHGDALLRALGREPSATGILEAAALPAALQALEASVAADEAARAQAEADAAARGEALPPRAGVTPRQRLWPMAEMIRRAQAAGVAIVWGV